MEFVEMTSHVLIFEPIICLLDEQKSRGTDELHQKNLNILAQLIAKP